MSERRDKPQVTVRMGEEFSPLRIKEGKPQSVKFLLEGIGTGKVEFVVLGKEGSEYAVDNAKKDSLNYISETGEEITLAAIPRHLGEFAVIVDYIKGLKDPPRLMCILRVGSLQFQAEGQNEDMDYEGEGWALFKSWGNEKVTPDYLLFHLDPTILSQIKIFFDKLEDK